MKTKTNETTVEQSPLALLYEALLEHGPQSLEALAERTGASGRKIRQLLTAMIRDEEVGLCDGEYFAHVVPDYTRIYRRLGYHHMRELAKELERVADYIYTLSTRT